MQPLPMKLEAVLAAQARLKPYIHQTQLLHSSQLSNLLDCKLYLKCENMQKVGAFKARGAMNFLLCHKDEGTTFCTYSSGNHGQALAWAAQALGKKAVIFMPEDASPVKVAAVNAYGGRIEYAGFSSLERRSACEAFLANKGGVMVPPFDDASIVAGQGTVALEVLEKLPKFDALFVPAGGGGLSSGCALVVNQLRSRAEVFPCEPENADDIAQSLAHGRLCSISHPNTIADGARNVQMGELNWALLRQTTREALTAPEARIVEAMALIATYTKMIVEPTGALGLACLLQQRERFRGQTLVVVLSGGNVEMAKYAALVAGHASAS